MNSWSSFLQEKSKLHGCNSFSLKKTLNTDLPPFFHSCTKGSQFVRKTSAHLRVYHRNAQFMPSVRVFRVSFEWSLLKSALSPGLDPEEPRSVFNSTFAEHSRWVFKVPHHQRFEPCGVSMSLSWGSPRAPPHVQTHILCTGISLDSLGDLHWTCNSAAKTKALQPCGDCWTLPSPGCAQRNGTRAQTEPTWALGRKICCDNCAAVTWDPFSSWLGLIIPIKTCREINNDVQRQDEERENTHIIRDAALETGLFFGLTTAENHKFFLVLPTWKI